MMEKVLTEALAQAPALVVLVLLVFKFLKHDRDRDIFIKQLHDEHMEARGESRDALVANTNSNVELTRTMESVRESIRLCPLRKENGVTS